MCSTKMKLAKAIRVDQVFVSNLLSPRKHLDKTDFLAAAVFVHKFWVASSSFHGHSPATPSVPLSTSYYLLLSPYSVASQKRATRHRWLPLKFHSFFSSLLLFIDLISHFRTVLQADTPATHLCPPVELHVISSLTKNAPYCSQSPLLFPSMNPWLRVVSRHCDRWQVRESLWSRWHSVIELRRPD